MRLRGCYLKLVLFDSVALRVATVFLTRYCYSEDRRRSDGIRRVRQLRSVSGTGGHGLLGSSSQSSWKMNHQASVTIASIAFSRMVMATCQRCSVEPIKSAAEETKNYPPTQSLAKTHLRAFFFREQLCSFFGHARTVFRSGCFPLRQSKWKCHPSNA